MMTKDKDINISVMKLIVFVIKVKFSTIFTFLPVNYRKFKPREHRQGVNHEERSPSTSNASGRVFHI